ncbi:hypothetical protein ATY76_01040 [Rhizobium sp. R339]|nr:hypothetical protein ATY76_01040 [Rhizobium sp. R339]
MTKQFYSVRAGKNKNSAGFPLEVIRDLFFRLFKDLRAEGFFNEYLGWYCVDQGDVPGLISSPDLDMMLKLRKDGLWPLDEKYAFYAEEDLLDVIEYLYSIVSKPIDGTYHSFNDCGMHWETFNKHEGEKVFREKINGLLDLYQVKFELSETGDVMHKPDRGFEAIFAADTPTKDKNIRERIDSAVAQYRRHGSNLDDRRQAVRDLADVLEYLRPQVKTVLDNKDENDLFNIANNFGIRHHNDKQKTGYDAALWLSWMFYIFLSTIHVVLRKINSGSEERGTRRK